MKVVHLIWGLRVGGAETLLIDIMNEQVSSAEVALVAGNACLDGTVLEALSGKVVTRFVHRPPGSWNPVHLFKLIHTIRTLGPDVIHAHQPSFAKIARTLSAPMVLTIHDTHRELESLGKYAAVYCISEAVKNDVCTRHPQCSPTVIHNGISFSRIRPKTSYGRGPFRIVQVGGLYHDKKGQDVLIRALQNVIREKGDGQVLVDFIGEGTSREYLDNLAKQLGVAKWCRFLGLQPRSVIYDQLHTYDLLVQPSRCEGFGLAIVEAMAARVPVLVSDIQAPMEVIGHGTRGSHFRAGDHLDCANKIVEFMSHSLSAAFQDQCCRIAEYAKEHFDVAQTAKKYLEEYESVISRSSASAEKS